MMESEADRHLLAVGIGEGCGETGVGQARKGEATNI